MKAIQSTLIFLAVLLGTAYSDDTLTFAPLKLRGCCPTVQYVSNLQFPRILGWYHRLFLTAEHIGPGCDGCIAQYNVRYNDASITLSAGCRVNGSFISGVEFGSGTVNPGQLNGEFTYVAFGKVYPVFVIDTDYETFTIVYGCEIFDDRRSDFIAVLTRQTFLEDATVERVMRVLKANNADTSMLRKIYQGEGCPYNNV